MRPSWQMLTVQDPRKTWLATGILHTVWWRMPTLGPRLPLAFRLWLSPACLSVSGWRWASPQPASSPWYLLNPCSEQAWLCFRLDLFTGKLSLSLFSLSLAIPQFVLLCHVSSLRLFSGHSGLVLTLSMQLMPSCSAPARWWQV